MIRLVLMRHAKSSWKSDTQTDHERPLNKRGRADAPVMARRLEAAGWLPDLALVSDAARTEETWAWMAGEFSSEVPMELDGRLYHGSLADIVDVAGERVPKGTRTVLVLGHNPGWEEAAALLTGEHQTMTTANMVLMTHDADWPVALGRRDWRFVDWLRPREPR